MNDMKKSLPDRIKDDLPKFWVIQKTEKKFSSKYPVTRWMGMEER